MSFLAITKLTNFYGTLMFIKKQYRRMTGRHVQEWRYRANNSLILYWIEVSGRLHTPAALSPSKDTQLPTE